MIAVLSDIHGNLPALQAVLSKIKLIGCTSIISLGDVAGYYAQPGECINLLMAHGALHIMGNHDSYLINGTGCPRSKLVSEMIVFQRRLVSPEQLQWLRQSVNTYNENGNYFTHGSWHDPLDHYLYEVSAEDIPPNCTILFTGHTHVQVQIAFNRKKYCNPGSVGQPRDGDPRAAFAVLTGNEFHLHRVEYDIDQTALAMKAANFPPYSYENLYIGTQIGGRIDKVISVPQHKETYA